MKKLNFIICLLISLGAFAQGSKPTKEQTISFLNQYYDLNQSWRSQGAINVDGINTFKVNKITLLEPCTLKIEWILTYRFISRDGSVNDETEYITTIDLSKVESLSYERAEKDEKHMDYLKFTASPNNKFSESSKGTNFGVPKEKSEQKAQVSIPIGTSWTNLTEEEIKVQKAFNHLRKLCGAPDPISFD